MNLLHNADIWFCLISASQLVAIITFLLHSCLRIDILYKSDQTEYTTSKSNQGKDQDIT